MFPTERNNDSEREWRCGDAWCSRKTSACLVTAKWLVQQTSTARLAWYSPAIHLAGKSTYLVSPMNEKKWETNWDLRSQPNKINLELNLTRHLSGSMQCCLSSLSGSSSCSWDVGMLMNHLDHLEIVGSNPFITNNDDDNNDDDDHHHNHNNNKVQTNTKVLFQNGGKLHGRP